MDLISEQVYLPSYRRRRNPRTTAAMVVGCAGIVYIMEKRYGVLDTAWKTMSRGMMALFAAWLEDMGGAALFTAPGKEPLEPDPAKYFPPASSRATTHKSAKPPGASAPGTPRPASTESSAKDAVKDLDVPEFLMSTKFFACLDLEDSKNIAEATSMLELQPHSLLFRAGDDGSEGIFVVVEGSLGMFLHDGEKLVQTNALQPGESVGDLDVIDGARRSITCMALGDGAKLVQLSRSLMVLWLTKRPHALYMYLQQAMSRLWRVANFMLSDYLQLPPPLMCTPNTAQLAAPLEPASSLLTESSFPAGFVAPRSTSDSFPIPANGDGAPAVGDIDAANGSSFEDSDTQQMGGASESTGTDSNTSTVFTAAQQPDMQGFLPSSASAMAMAEAVARRAEQVKEYQMLGADTMEVVKRVLATPPMPTYGGVEWVNHWQDSNGPGAADGALVGSGLGPQSSVRVNTAPQERGSEMWYYTQREQNAGVMRPVQQLEPRPPVEAFAAAGWDCVNSMEAQLGGNTVQKLRQHSITRLMLNIVPKEDNGHMCRLVRLTPGTELLPQGRASWQMLILLEGKVTLERTVRGTAHTALARPGSILAAASFLCRSTTAESFTAATACTVLAVGEKELDVILASSPGAYLDVLFAASKALGYIIRRFVSLGLNRVWTRSGDVVYQQGMAADCLYVVISGRVRLVTKSSQHGPVQVEEEVARGQAVGAIWAINNQTHDTSAVAVRDSELVRFSRQSFEVISRSAPEAAAVVLSQMASRLLNARRVRMRASADKQRTPLRPFAPVGTISGDDNKPKFSALPVGTSPSNDRRSTRERSNGQSSFVDQTGNIVTIAIVPAGSPPLTPNPTQQRSAVRRLSNSLKRGLEETEGNQCTIITWQMLNVWFPQICDRLQVPFYRTKVTSWMASMEEEYRFIIMEADASEDPNWAQLCVEQADLILLVATENGSPEVTAAEKGTVWRLVNPPTASVEAHPVRLSHSGHRIAAGVYSSSSRMGSVELTGGTETVCGTCFTADGDDEDGVAAPINKHDWLSFARRVELVLLQEPTCKAPSGTLAWLKLRPGLVRHHHVRLPEIKDVSRLCRWIAGKAVGLVLSGGGSRGLAHLGVLQALDDVGTPVDVIGGTSQGAFMAALYAQGLDKDELTNRVRAYATAMASPRRLLSDITLPVLSLFSGKMFDGHLQETFDGGPQEIEDLWLPFFCVSTNLSNADVEVHQVGSLWKFVRASMTIVGMLPPVINNGEMLVDGGYLNNVPVDIMHSLGVQHVIVADVEDKQSGAWHNLTAYDGGLSGWRVLWDRYCPIPSWRFAGGNPNHPRYRELVNALSWIAHSQNLRRMCQDYKVDLVLSPPYASNFKLMDFHLIDSIVRDAYRYSFGALTAWLERRQPGLRKARVSAQPAGAGGARRANSFDDSNRLDTTRPWSSVSNMLHHKKQSVKPVLPGGILGEAPRERPIRVHVASLTGTTNTSRDTTQQSVTGAAAPSITGAAQEAAHHQSPSADSLTEASAVPAIGDQVHYKESELMRMTANALEAAASHTRQATVGPADVTGQMALPPEGRYPPLTSVAFPQLDQHTTSSWLRERSSSQPVSSMTAAANFKNAEEVVSSAPTTPTAPIKGIQASISQEDVPVSSSNPPPQRSVFQVTFSQSDGTTDRRSPEGGSGESSDGGISFRDMLAATSEKPADAGAVVGDKPESSLASSSDAGSPRAEQDISVTAAALWPTTATGVDHVAADRPESPGAMSRRRSSRTGCKQLHTISEAENESS